MTPSMQAADLGPHDLAREQEELEAECLARGSRRYSRALNKARDAGTRSRVGASRRLLRHALDPLEDAIRHLCERHGPGRPSLAEAYCRFLGYGVASFLTLKVVLDNLGGTTRKGRWHPNTVVRVARDISQHIQDDVRARLLKKMAPRLARAIDAGFNTRSYVHKSRVYDANYRHVASGKSSPRFRMDDRTKVLVGTKLLDLLIRSTGLVTKESRRSYSRGRWRTEVYLVPTQETVAWLRKSNEYLASSHAMKLPLVIPPRDWALGVRGGYHFGLSERYGLVRGWSKQGKIVETANMPDVYGALNAIQRTPWRINQDVLQFVQEVVARGVGIAGLPAFENESPPARPPSIDYDDLARISWRRAAHAVHERNHERRCKAVALALMLRIADRMKDHGAFYFAWNTDFRGRLYPIASYLSPQGNDASRALLTFAEGKPLGESGARRLGIYGVGLLHIDPWSGRRLDSLPFQERLDWLGAHSSDVLSVADDPWSNKWWQQAEKPLQFYAFCLEWRGYMEHGINYVCSLPISMDATCNGLQHFAAMMRDPSIAKSVNLLPSHRPQDLYKDVADRVMDSLVETAMDPSDETKAILASLWLKSALVTRDIVKGPAMTFGYGAREFGFADLIADAVPTEQRPEFRVEDVDHFHMACRCLASHLWVVLHDMLESTFEAMDWLGQLAKTVVQNTRRPIRWTTPTGFPVQQGYFKTRYRQIKTQLAGSVFKPKLPESTEDIDVRRQLNGIAANFVHSLDASALAKAVNLAQSRGIGSFSVVHDCYGTVPADADTLARAVREAFAGMYTDSDVLELFRDACRDQLGGDSDLPPRPTRGDLDLSPITDSEYFLS